MNALAAACRIAAAALTVLVATQPSRAVERRPPAAPLAMTISGGGTKGAYMAGHLYYTGEVSRLGGGALQPRIFTGASAGAINSMIALLSSCMPAQPDPTQTLYWSTWTETGLNQVFDPAETRGTGLLTTKAFQPAIERMRRIWDAGLPTRCDVLIGVAITRLQARSVVLAPGFPPLPRSRETALLRITGQGPGQPPRVHNVVDPARPIPALLLPLDGPDADPFKALTTLVLASAAFPVGFGPVDVPHCMSPPGGAPACTPHDATSGLFVDGGIFDNQPLGLAVRAMRHVQRDASGLLSIIEAPDADAPPLIDGARFYFLDPRARTYPNPPESADGGPAEDVVDIVAALLGMIESGSAAALMSVLEEAPEVRDRLLLGRTYFRQISGTFNGLLERSFREFDLYLGMYNAARSVREHPLTAHLPAIAPPVDSADASLAAAWRPYHCLRAVLDGVGDPAVCDGTALQDFRILLQLVLDQLADDCRRAAAAATAPVVTDHPQCAAAIAGAPTPAVPGVRQLPAAERVRGANESPLSFQLRLLGRYRFHFRDLGLAREDAELAPDALVRVAHIMAQAFADAQPSNGWVLGVLGRIGVDVGLGYVPPQHSVHASLGLGGEIGYSGALADPDWDWLRFGVAIGFDGLSTIFNAIDDYLAIIPKAGLEFEVLGLAEVQLRLGVRAGYQFSTADDFSTGDCDFANEARRPCSRVVTEAYLSASVLGLLRVQIAGVYEPSMHSGQDDAFSVRPTVGFQFNSPF